MPPKSRIRPSVPGYPKMAETFSAHPAMQIFRKFTNLNGRSLLYYQAELTLLEQELTEAEKRDHERWTAGYPGCMASDFWALKEADIECGDETEGQGDCDGEEAVIASEAAASTTSEQRSNGQDSEAQTRWDIIYKMRALLEEYYQALNRQIQFEDIYSAPHPRDLSNLREWYNDTTYGGNGFLGGTPEDVWHENKDLVEEDFVRISGTGDSLSNRLGVWIAAAAPALQRLREGVALGLKKKQRQKQRSTDVEMNTPAATQAPSSQTTGPPADLDDDPMPTVESLTASQYQIVSNTVLIILSSTLSVLPIVILYIVQQHVQKSDALTIGLIYIFTVLLAAATTFGMNVSAERVMGITMAFAAVQVVFIASNADCVK